jgi:heptosyltransferase-2
MRALKWLDHYAAALTEPAFDRAVYSSAADYQARNSLSKRIWLRAKRDLVMLFTLQLPLVRKCIPPDAKRILYVYLGTPNLGDSIMDLSPRTLWAEPGLRVDMYTNEVIASLYKNDPSFNQVIVDSKELASNYDFIVLQSYSWRCLKFKWRNYLLKPFTSLHGHYYGCEFNRLDFSEAAWRSVMRLPATEVSEKCPVIFNLSVDHLRSKHATRAKTQIALAVGGVVDWRTYTKWSEVIEKVTQQQPEVEWVLIGSENGMTDAKVIEKKLDAKITNLVCQLPLNDVFRKLQDVSLLVASDGGLMNVGRAASVPIVALFAREIHPRMRFSEWDSAYVIHAPNAVSDISPSDIAEAVISSLENPSEKLTERYLGSEPVCSK